MVMVFSPFPSSSSLILLASLSLSLCLSVSPLSLPLSPFFTKQLTWSNELIESVFEEDVDEDDEATHQIMWIRLMWKRKVRPRPVTSMECKRTHARGV